MPIVRTSAKGQVVIPTEIRKRTGLKAGDKVSVQDHDGVIVIVPVPQDPLKSLRGILKGGPSLVEALLESRQEERRREEEKASRYVRDSGVAKE